MKQSLQLKLSQQLAMTPQLQQAIRLLQLSTPPVRRPVPAMITATMNCRSIRAKPLKPYRII